MLLSFLIACGGDTAETTEVVNTTATVTEEGIEVVETTTELRTTLGKKSRRKPQPVRRQRLPRQLKIQKLRTETSSSQG